MKIRIKHHRRRWLAAIAGLCCLGANFAAVAADAPDEITVGTLYASSGVLASESMPLYHGLQFWAKQANADGGVFVKAYGKKIPVKLVAYNDQSSTSLAASLYTRLITQDDVDVLTAGFGSIMTSVAVPLARAHKKLLIDQVGTSQKFFTKDNPYIIQADVAPTRLWAPPINGVLKAAGSKRVAILYSTNDFTGPIAETLNKELNARGVKPVYYHGVPTDTSSYQTLLRRIQSQNPDAIVELGYTNNDIAFFKALSTSGLDTPFVFAIYPGTQTSTLVDNVGVDPLVGTFSFTQAPDFVYKNVNFGMTAPQFVSAYRKANGDDAEMNYNVAAGYHTGVIIQKALATADSLDSLAMRKAIFGFSGKLRTLMGNFKLDDTGAQVGEGKVIAEVERKSDDAVRLVPVFPTDLAERKPQFGKRQP